MTVEDLPPYLYHDIYDDDDPAIVKTYPFFLSVSRDLQGKWSCGYVSYADEFHDEFAIPQLVTNSSDNLHEVAIRMDAKLARYNKS